MNDYIEIGPSPGNEECVQVGDGDYYQKARHECRRFIDLIRSALGSEPEGARLFIKRSPHDFGDYLEVACEYDEDFPAAIDYAFKCESEALTTWGVNNEDS